jgi:hypothetical protein
MARMINFFVKKKTVNPKLKYPFFSKAKMSLFGRRCIVAKILFHVWSRAGF